MYVNMKKHGIPIVILFILELFANVKRVGSYIKPSPGHLDM